ncbi:MAG: hypothetical protein WD053_09910 [Gracilimonas sp.]
MKFTTIQLGNNKIELFNSLLGKETVKVNGEIVSSRYSFFGAEHTFTVNEDGRDVDCSVKFGFGMNGIVFDLYKGGTPIIESEKSGCMGMLMMFVMIMIVFVLLSLLF